MTDGVVQATVSRREALALLEEHLLRNTVYLPRCEKGRKGFIAWVEDVCVCVCVFF